MSIVPERQTPPGPTAQATAPSKKKRTLRREILSWILTLAIAAGAALLIRTYLFEPIRVDGESMTNTLHDKELMLVTKPEYIWGTPSHQDVIICRYPHRTEYFVKRLIGLPGDTVEIRFDSGKHTNTVYVNGQALDEPYLTDEKNNSNNAFAPITLGPDQYFVLGDNRDNSNDSRYVGTLTRDQIVGHVRFVFYPFTNGNARAIK